MMLDCKYCGGTGKLHDDADAFDGHESDEWKARAEKAEFRAAREREDWQVMTANAQTERDAAIARVKRLEMALETIANDSPHWDLEREHIYETAKTALEDE